MQRTDVEVLEVDAEWYYQLLADGMRLIASRKERNNASESGLYFYEITPYGDLVLKKKINGIQTSTAVLSNEILYVSGDLGIFAFGIKDFSEPRLLGLFPSPKQHWYIDEMVSVGDQIYVFDDERIEGNVTGVIDWINQIQITE